MLARPRNVLIRDASNLCLRKAKKPELLCAATGDGTGHRCRPSGRAQPRIAFSLMRHGGPRLEENDFNLKQSPVMFDFRFEAGSWRI